MFSTSFDHSGREPTCYGIFGQQEREKSWEMQHSKKVKFQDLLKLAYFLIFNFFGFSSITSLKTIQIENVWGVLKNSGNLQQDGLKNWKEIDGEMSEIMEPKVDNPKNSVSRNWATLCLP